ncbi:MAG: bifunctional methylenetetrahydrofolate dehydrogenase/methenyltetrahydrofolate cyclohydrolase FolD [Gammaproteobacteria bacterium]|nr:bifunctional methylenetetrahydrofolate dehydrogenase/methenyltetrahydrofolate cyclohydrolase FolD [Gammaproteobacteria bacterium]
MTAKILNGERIAKDIRKQVKEKLEQRRQRGLRLPNLSVVLVGEDPASELYVRLKKRDCEEAGIECHVYHLPASAREVEVCALVRRINSDPLVDGILVQLPLPSHLNDLNVISEIDPRKDIDGVSPHNMGLLSLRHPAHRSCTPKGVMTLLEHTGETLLGTHSVVIGASNHVGRPMGLELLLVGSTVTTAHKFTRNTKELAREADVLVSATGKAGLIEADWVKPGAIVIDVGIDRQPDGSLRGDVDFESVSEVASWITPVPGGVGPMTRVSLLQNLLDSVNRATS